MNEENTFTISAWISCRYWSLILNSHNYIRPWFPCYGHVNLMCPFVHLILITQRFPLFKIHCCHNHSFKIDKYLGIVKQYHDGLFIYGTVSSILLLNTDSAVVPLSLALPGTLALYKLAKIYLGSKYIFLTLLLIFSLRDKSDKNR